jgi:hypothetical protein
MRATPAATILLVEDEPALRRTAWLGVAVAAAALTGCEGGGNPPTERTLFDQPVLSSMERVELDAGPEIDSVLVVSAAAIHVIGQAQGHESYLFQEIADVQVHARVGELYVADVGRKQILAYSMDDGRFLRAMGGPGGGPGEFQELASIFLVSDSVIGAWDPALARLSQFALSGNAVTTLALETSGGNAFNLALGRTAKRLRWLLDGYLVELRSNPLEVAPEEQLGALVRLDRRLGVRDTVLRFLVSTIRAAENATAGGRTVHYEAPPIFSPSASWTVSPDGSLAFAPGGPYEIVLVAPDRSRQPTALRRRVPLESVTTEDRIRRLEHEASKPGSGFPPGFAVAEFERRVRERFSAHRPSVTGLLWDGPGRIWVRGFDTMFDPEGRGGTWDVVDLGERRIRHVLRFEHGLTPVAALASQIFCVQRDSLGVERLLILPHPLSGGGQ